MRLKPKKLDLYFAKKFLATLGFILLMTALISVVFDASEKIDDILEGDVTLHTIVFDYYFNFVPVIINLTTPLLIFLSTLYFTARLANNAEVLAVLSSGTSYYRLLVPYIAVAILLAGVDLGLKNFILPHAHAKVLAFEDRYVNGEYHYEAKNIHRQLDKQSYFYAQGISYKERRAYRFAIDKFEGQNLVYKLTSTDAIYDSTAGSWTVYNYVTRTINGLHETLQRGDTMRIKIPITMKDFSAKSKAIATLTTPELNKFIDEERFKGESLVDNYLVEKYKRIAMPFAIIILVVIAVALGTRKVRGGIGTHLLVGILIAISYELAMRFSTTFATNSDLNPILAVWLPNIVYGIAALYLLKVTPK
ncbi:MAG: YjgP/YjgQ family permease [Sphingobacteriales bacterium]|nr:MAG: YjgP/YjgQ family permease [Sphingobacteriales bacterium]